jgi:hypothetical protein
VVSDKVKIDHFECDLRDLRRMFCHAWLSPHFGLYISWWGGKVTENASIQMQ